MSLRREATVDDDFANFEIPEEHVAQLAAANYEFVSMLRKTDTTVDNDQTKGIANFQYFKQSSQDGSNRLPATERVTSEPDHTNSVTPTTMPEGNMDDSPDQRIIDSITADKIVDNLATGNVQFLNSTPISISPNPPLDADSNSDFALPYETFRAAQASSSALLPDGHKNVSRKRPYSDRSYQQHLSDSAFLQGVVHPNTGESKPFLPLSPDRQTSFANFTFLRGDVLERDTPGNDVYTGVSSEPQFHNHTSQRNVNRLPPTEDNAIFKTDRTKPQPQPLKRRPKPRDGGAPNDPMSNVQFLNNELRREDRDNSSGASNVRNSNQTARSYDRGPLPVEQRQTHGMPIPQMMMSNVSFLRGDVETRPDKTRSHTRTGSIPTEVQAPPANVDFLADGWNQAPPANITPLNVQDINQFSRLRGPRGDHPNNPQTRARWMSISPQQQQQIQQQPSNISFLQGDLESRPAETRSYTHVTVPPLMQAPPPGIDFPVGIPTQPPPPNVEFLVGSRDRSHRFLPFAKTDPKFVIESPADGFDSVPRLSNSSYNTSTALSNTRANRYTPPSFKYPPFPEDGPPSLRLIRFDPDYENDPNGNIYCELSQINPWGKCINYHCLSYCWGEEGKSRLIFLKMSDNPDAHYTHFVVTENLFTALYSIKSTKPGEWLWIDAISINQNDLSERSAQVAMMKEIYSKAASVIIWLGASEAAITADPVISSISTRFFEDTKLEHSSIIGPDGLKLNPDDLDQLKKSTITTIGTQTPTKAYEILAEFFSLPWFRRVWVLQEAFSNTTVTVQIGVLSHSWGSIILAALWQSFLARTYTANSERSVVNSAPRGAGHLPELWLGLLHNRGLRGLSMVELVCRARDFQASDPRDKVFALLGLANDINTGTRPLGLQPNYHISKEEVYCEFATSIIQKTRQLDILSAVDRFTKEALPLNVPTWMPDLDVSVATIRGLGFPRKYNAASSSQVDSYTIKSRFDDRDVLSFSGFIIDSVSPTMSNLLTLSKDLRLYLDNEPNAVSKLWTDYVHLDTLSDPKETLMSYIHTLTAAGFALPTSFPKHPLGDIVPPQQVPSLIYDFAAYHSRTDHAFSIFPDPSYLMCLDGGDADQFAVLAGKACHERKFFLTQEGRMGLCPRGTVAWDKIVVLYGGSVPYVLREWQNGMWLFVGECYVDGMMFGEAGLLKEEKGIEAQVFDVV